MPHSILIDTTVASLDLRRRAERLSTAEREHVAHLRELIALARAAIIAPIRQELLTGITTADRFASVQRALDQFSHLSLLDSTFDLAADCSNRCIVAGIAFTTVDMMLCAASIQNRLPIWTFDNDFSRYLRVVPLPALYLPPTSAAAL